MLDREFDLRKRSESIRIICGTDEAGRGPLAGPVAAGACILPDGYIPECLDDSKKLTEKKREAALRADHRKRSRMGNRSCKRRRNR